MEIVMTYTYKGVCITMLVDKHNRKKSAKNTIVFFHSVKKRALSLLEFGMVTGHLNKTSRYTEYQGIANFMEKVNLLNEGKIKLKIK